MCWEGKVIEGVFQKLLLPVVGLQGPRVTFMLLFERFELVILFGSVLPGLILNILILGFFILHRCQIHSFYMFSECMFFHTCSKNVRQRDSQLSLGMFAKFQKATVSFFLSVCQYGTNRLPLDIFSWNLIFEDFSKICFENSSLIKIWQEWQVLYMKMYIHLW